MRMPLSWLAEHVAHGLDPEALAERLDMTGTAVESIERRGVPDADGNLARFVVGRVISAEQHPNADRLRVCVVDTGDAEPRQIVCGAPNVAAGQHVPVALPGALLPGSDRPLGTAKLRGVESNGMICSARELELGEDHAGIMVLADAPTPGTPVGEILPIAGETVLDLEITSNRPDCLSIAGLAREIAAVTGHGYCPPVTDPPVAQGPGRTADHLAVRVDDPDLCSRYLARVLVDVTVAPSPEWLQRRLDAAGMRPISNVVDITNYVMLLTGQPLHAFDLDRVAGPEIVVRRARAGERIVTLDGQERLLSAEMLLICDGEGPTAVAGVMGGGDSEVEATTTRVLLEAATFDGPSVMRASVALGLRTESSARFEKGLRPELAQRGSDLACRLIAEICGGKLVEEPLDVAAAVPELPLVTMRHARAAALLGMEVDPDVAVDILTRLGCTIVEAGRETLSVRVPFERAGDLTREADLIEEVGRIHGYEHVEAALPRSATPGGRTPMQTLRERVADRLVTRGFSEIVGYRFVPADDLDRLGLAADDPRRNLVRLAHPISEEFAVMRRATLPGLLRAAAHNQARQRPGGRIFEIGRVYSPREDGMADETDLASVLVFGPQGGGHWRSREEAFDLHSGLGLMADLAGLAGARPVAVANEAPYFHPRRQARLEADGAIVGWVGEVHPRVLREFEVRGPATMLVLSFAGLMAAASSGLARYEPVLTVPASTRDLSLVLDEEVSAARVLAVARAAGGALVRAVRVFDRYTGEGIGAGRVSLAIRLEIADPERTLVDAEIDAPVAAVVAALTSELGAELRGRS